MWGERFQIVVTTHLNTKHLHCHFVVNSVSFVDGKRMANNEKHWRHFRHIADELCRKYQLDVIENPHRGTGKNYYARKLHEAGMPNYVDMQDFCHTLKEDFDIGSTFYLVGSGAKNLIVQNASQPIDLDYNLEIVRCEDFEDCRTLKECARKAFNKALSMHGWGDCEDSTSSLTTERRRFTPSGFPAY